MNMTTRNGGSQNAEWVGDKVAGKFGIHQSEVMYIGIMIVVEM